MSTLTLQPHLPKGPKVNEAKRLLHAKPQAGWVELVQQYGRTFIYQNALATCEPELVQKVLMNRVHTQKRSAVYKFMAWLIPGAPGVLFMDGEEWQRHVTAVMPVFTRANIDTYTQTMHRTVAGYVANWQEGQRLDDLYQTITDIGLQAILRVGYGLDPENTTVSRYGQELRNYKWHTMNTEARLDDFGLSWDQLRILPAFVKSIRFLKKNMQRQQHLVASLLAERKAAGDLDGRDWFSLLHKASFPLKVITNELNHIYGAFNAIDYTISCGFYELSKNPEWVQIIRAELKQVLGSREYPTREDFEYLPNTINFMKEVNRYYPVALSVMRRLGEDLPVNGTIWPKDKEVLILLQSMHHHPDFWNEPEVFNPNRWTIPMKEPLAYTPFLTGPRQCIGKHLAELHFVITLNAILQKASLTVLDHTVQIKPYMNPRFAAKLPALVNFN